VNPLPIPLRLPVKHRILILRHHLLLLGHLGLPSLYRFAELAGLCKRGVDGRDHIIDHAQAFALTSFLGGGKAPGDFPVDWLAKVVRRAAKGKIPEQTAGEGRGAAEGTEHG